MFGSEERLIVERIKDYIKNEKPSGGYYIMLKNGRILYIDEYFDMVSRGKINPQNAYVYIGIDWNEYKPRFYYPFLVWDYVLLDAYLSKLGFYYRDHVVPANGLKYVAVAERYEKYLTIEVSDLNTAVNNTNLRTITFEVVGEKLISREGELTYLEYDKIYDMLRSQNLFAGRNFYGHGAKGIIIEYYDNDNKSLAKEVARIAMDYYRIFNPYRVCYDMDNWKEVVCFTIT